MMEETTFAVIFDMDGVIIDSTRYIWEAFNEEVKPLGIHFDGGAVRKYLGNSLRDQISMWKRDYGMDVGSVKEFAERTHKIEMRLMKEARPNNGLMKFLLELKKRGVLIGLGTSSTKERAKNIISLLEIRDYFDAFVTAEDVNEHKPSPHLFLEVAKRLSVLPERCVVIEDAKVGIEAAKKGKMKAIGFLTEWNHKDDFRDADLIVRGFDELSYENLRRLMQK